MEGEGACRRPSRFPPTVGMQLRPSLRSRKHPILIWDLKTGKRIHTGLTLNDKIKEKWCIAVSFSPDDRRVMAALKNGTVLVWDLATEQEQPPITLEAGPIKQDEFPCSGFQSRSTASGHRESNRGG